MHGLLWMRQHEGEGAQGHSLLTWPCVQINALTAASEASCLILSVDETVKAPTSQIVSCLPAYLPAVARAFSCLDQFDQKSLWLACYV